VSHQRRRWCTKGRGGWRFARCFCSSRSSSSGGEHNGTDTGLGSVAVRAKARAVGTSYIAFSDEVSTSPGASFSLGVTADNWLVQCFPLLRVRWMLRAQLPLTSSTSLSSRLCRQARQHSLPSNFPIHKFRLPRAPWPECTPLRFASAVGRLPQLPYSPPRAHYLRASVPRDAAFFQPFARNIIAARRLKALPHESQPLIGGPWSTQQRRRHVQRLPMILSATSHARRVTEASFDFQCCAFSELLAWDARCDLGQLLN
jgi:hypothetical protein